MITGEGAAEACREAIGAPTVSPEMVKWFDAFIAYLKANMEIEGPCTGLTSPPGGGSVTGTAVLPAGSIK